jgi:hypothetical protein
MYYSKNIFVYKLSVIIHEIFLHADDSSEEGEHVNEDEEEEKFNKAEKGWDIPPPLIEDHRKLSDYIF